MLFRMLLLAFWSLSCILLLIVLEECSNQLQRAGRNVCSKLVSATRLKNIFIKLKKQQYTNTHRKKQPKLYNIETIQSTYMYLNKFV